MSIDNRYKYGALSVGVILGLLAIAIYSGSKATDSSQDVESASSQQESTRAPALPSEAASGAAWRDDEPPVGIGLNSQFHFISNFKCMWFSEHKGTCSDM